MKYLWIGLALVLLTGALLPAQQLKVVTRATPPPREAMERLSLVQAWHARVPVHGQRDGLYSVQVLPGERTQLVAQTSDGLVALLDGETGDVLWRTQVGIPGWVTQRAGANAHSVFVTRRHELHVLNRRSGYERVYTVDGTTRQVTYGMPLLALPSAEPAAEAETVYLSMANKMVAYALPLFELPPRKIETASEPVKKDEGGEGEPVKEPPPVKETPPVKLPPGKPPVKAVAQPDSIRPTESSLQPRFLWSYSTGDEGVQQPPLLGGNQVATITSGGGILSLNKFEGKLRGEYRIASHISRPAGNHGAQVYVGGDDTYVYAVNMDNGSLLWRHLAGAALIHRPAVTDRDVFIAPGREGLLRLQRLTGRELWRNRQVNRFLAVNQRFVYATDGRGHFHVLDGLRGTTLAKYDLEDWIVTVPNEFTDRVYLASRDGQVLCFRHREHPVPLAMKVQDVRKKIEVKVPAEDAAKVPDVARPAEEKKVEEKKAEEKKEERKDDEKKEEKKDDEKKEEKKDDEKKEEKTATLLRPGVDVAAGKMDAGSRGRNDAPPMQALRGLPGPDAYLLLLLAVCWSGLVVSRRGRRRDDWPDS